MRRLFKGGVYLKITFLNLLTVNHLKMLCQTERCFYKVP